jgi:hypothetical protein
MLTKKFSFITNDWNGGENEKNPDEAKKSDFSVHQERNQNKFQWSLANEVSSKQSLMKLAEVVRQQIDHSSLQATNLR